MMSVRFVENDLTIADQRDIMSNLKLYIAVLDEVPDFIVPTLVAHTVLNAHFSFSAQFAGVEYSSDEINMYNTYFEWLDTSFKKCVIRVNQKEFDKISAIPYTYLGHENKTLGGKKTCAIVPPMKEYPNVLKYAKLWAPKQTGE